MFHNDLVILFCNEYRRKFRHFVCMDYVLSVLKILFSFAFFSLICLLAVFMPYILQEMQVTDYDNAMANIVTYSLALIFLTRFLSPLRLVNITYYLLTPIKTRLIVEFVYLMDLICSDNCMVYCFLSICLCVLPVSMQCKIISLLFFIVTLSVIRVSIRITKTLALKSFPLTALSGTLLVCIALFLYKMPVIIKLSNLHPFIVPLLALVLYIANIAVFYKMTKLSFYEIKI